MGRKGKFTYIRRQKWMFLLLLPGLIYFIVFKYIPMFGIIIAFQDFNPYSGFTGSPWVGLKNFTNFFTNPDFLRLLRNTLGISLLSLALYFPAPIILALLLNEIQS